MKPENFVAPTLVATGLLLGSCGSDPSSGGMASATASDSSASATSPAGDGPQGGAGAPAGPSGAPSRPAMPLTPPDPGSTSAPSGSGGTGAGPSAGGGNSGGGGGGSNLDDCDVVVSFDEPWGVVATGGGTVPMEWETTVTPAIAGGVFSVEVPFESSAQQFGWNGDHPGGVIDCTGRELVARVRLLSGFVEDPQSAPGGVLMYLFSDTWANSRSAWTNVPAPSEAWFEVAVACEASADSAFEPSAVNGIGFTFNTGGEDAASYVATPASFEVDQLCWRGRADDSGSAGAGGGGGTGGTSAGSGGTGPEGGAGGLLGGAGGAAGAPGGAGGFAGSGGAEASDAGVALDAGVTDADASVGGAPGIPDAGLPAAGAGGMGGSGMGGSGMGGSGMGGSGMGGSGMGGSGGGSGGASGGTGGAATDDCEIVVGFDSTWGVVGGGVNPAEWEATVEPTIADGVFGVLVPFESATQQFGWVGDHPGGTTDCTGWELVARVRLLSGFVESPQTAPGGILMYLFSDAWGNARSAWNDVPEPSEDWFEASVFCDAAQGSAFDPTALNGIGFTFNTGGEDPSDYEASPAEFEVDHLCWRR